MRDQDLEQRLRTAVEHAAPDPLERILASCDTQKGTVIPMTNQKKRWASVTVAAILAVMLCGGFGLHGWQTAHAVASVVSLDVNPSIQLQVNRKEKVLSAEALNEDAQVILEGMDLKGTQLNVAVNAIVGSLLQHGYLDRLSSAILISVEDNDIQRASRLETALTAEVDAALQNAAAGAAVLSQVVTYDAGLEPQAQANRISVGKAALIQRVQGLNGKLAFEDLAALSVEELKQLWETGAPGLPIGKDAAAYAAQEYAGLLEVDSVTWDVDPELDETPAHYEVELKTASGEFDYEIGAYNGEILKGLPDLPRIALKDEDLEIMTTQQNITAEKAQAIALEHAGVEEADALGLQVKQDWESGRLTYEVEFRAGGAEYEYELLASDGTILKAEQDQDDWFAASSGGMNTGTSAQAAYIGEAAAKSAALRHAGVSAADAVKLKCELDEDDGVWLYEVEFEVGRTEYEYKIDAATGAVLKAEQDTDD